MTFTERALSAGIINAHEAEALENWIDENCHKVSVHVPDHLIGLWERVMLYNYKSEVLQ